MADWNIFSAPDYYGGLLGEEATKKLENKALGTGLFNAVLGYIAQPKNQRYGSALPYLGKALAGGYQAGQETLKSGLTDYETQQKIAEMQRKKDQQKATQELISGITDPTEKLAAQIAPEQYVAAKLKPTTKAFQLLNAEQSKAYGLPDAPSGQAWQVSEKGYELVGSSPKDSQPSAVQEYNFARSQGYKGSFEDWKKSQKPEGVNVTYGAPVSGVDAQGNPVFFQPAKAGGLPSIIPGVTPPAPKPAEAATKQLTGIENLQSAIGDYRERLKTWSPLDAADPKKRADMTTTYNNMMLQAKEAYGLGVLNGPDYKILTDTVADPTSTKGLIYGAAGALDPQAAALDRLMGNMKQTIKSTQPGARQEQKPEVKQEQPVSPSSLKVGDVKNGYVYKGGNPNDQKSWIKKGNK